MAASEVVVSVRSVKANLNHDTRLRIPVRADDGRLLGFLECIDRGLANSREIASQLTKWRRMFMRYFLTQFEASEERTERWLRDVVMPADDRILFRIIAEDGSAIGNFGVCGISPGRAELDNLIRGERGGDPRLIYFSEVSLLRWLFQNFHISDVYLHVFSNNSKTLALHSSVGFGEQGRFPLTKEVTSDGVHYLVGADRGEAVEFDYVRMGLSRLEFESRHGRIGRVEDRAVLPSGAVQPDVEAEFDRQRGANSRRAFADERVRRAANAFIMETAPFRYAYNFRWLGRPIIQLPQDMIAMQEIIWAVRPDLVIETGVAHGGSIIYYASLLELSGHGEVVGIDIDIRAHNRAAIEVHPMYRRIRLIQGSSIEPKVIAEVQALAAGKRAIVVLDSNHTHEHVLAELRAYAPLVCVGGYCVVMDTVVADMPADFFPDRPWGIGNNPKTAVREFLQENRDFEIDRDIEARILISVAPDGYIKRVR